VGMIVRILTTCFFIALSPAVSGMIFIPYATSHLEVNHEITPSHRLSNWGVFVIIRLMLATTVYYI
jgi:hypothetical protein